MNLNFKWYHLLIFGALIGSGITIAVFHFFLKPSPNIKYQLEAQRQQIEIDNLHKTIIEDKAATKKMTEQWQKDTIDLNKQLNDFKNDKIGKKYAPAHAHVRMQSVDDDVQMSRHSFPSEDPY